MSHALLPFFVQYKRLNTLSEGAVSKVMERFTEKQHGRWGAMKKGQMPKSCTLSRVPFRRSDCGSSRFLQILTVHSCDAYLFSDTFGEAIVAQGSARSPAATPTPTCAGRHP